MPTVAHLPALVIETDGTIDPEQIPVSSYWAGTTQKVRAEHHGRGAAFDAVRDTWVLFHPIRDAPGTACMAVGANHQADERQPINVNRTGVSGDFDVPQVVRSSFVLLQALMHPREVHDIHPNSAGKSSIC